MTITTKFNVEDSAWMMSNNKATEVEIVAIIPIILFDLHEINYVTSNSGNGKTLEKNLFATKEELLNSL